MRGNVPRPSWWATEIPVSADDREIAHHRKQLRLLGLRRRLAKMIRVPELRTRWHRQSASADRCRTTRQSGDWPREADRADCHREDGALDAQQYSHDTAALARRSP